MFRQTATITAASIASIGLMSAVALGATFSLDSKPQTQLEEIQVFPKADEPLAALPQIDIEQPAPPLTLPPSNSDAPPTDTAIDRAATPRRPAPKKPTAILPPTAEEAKQPLSSPTPSTPELPEATAPPENSETVESESSQPAPVEVVLPPVVENPVEQEGPAGEPDTPIGAEPSDPEHDAEAEADQNEQNPDPWEDVIDDWKDKIDEGDWDISLDWDDGEREPNSNDDPDE